MSALLLDYLTPESLGLDGARFPSFRNVQLEAIEKAAYSEKRFVGLCCPTGLGKSLLAMGLSRFQGQRTVILTHTRGLQDQYLSDFGSSGLVDIRGRSNYECSSWEMNCSEGSEAGCSARSLCTYEIEKAKAMSADSVITNYSYWLTVNDKGQGLERSFEDLETGEISGQVGQLILDEGHYANSAIESYLSFELNEREMSSYVDTLTMGSKIEDWIAAAKLIDEDLKAEIKTLRLELQLYKNDRGKARRLLEMLKRTKSLWERVNRLAWASPDDWVCEKQEGTAWGRRWTFDVIWPGRYAEKYLFCGVEKVVLMSATLTRKTMGLLGIPKDQYEFFEWPRQFPAQRNPMFYFPVIKNDKPLRISRGTSEVDLQSWVDRIDELVEPHQDRRIAIITTSYRYQEQIKELSRFGGLMVGNTQDPESDSAREVFEKFVKTPPPVILCSPSFGTGWDMKRDRCEVLIIPKLPLRPPPNTSTIMSARVERDKEYYLHETMQDLIQWCGRGMRAEDDRCVVYLLDGSWDFFRMRAGRLATRGFVEGIRKVNKMQGVAPKL